MSKKKKSRHYDPQSTTKKSKFDIFNGNVNNPGEFIIIYSLIGVMCIAIVTGDFDKTIKQFSICDGRLINEMPVDGEVVGRITISEGYLYTVIWGNSEKDIRLVKIQIS